MRSKGFHYFMNWLYADGTRCLFSGAVTKANDLRQEKRNKIKMP